MLLEQLGRVNSRLLVKIPLAVLFVAGLVWAWSQLHQPDTLPINSVRIEGSYNHIKREQLEKTVMPFIQMGFFAMDVTSLQKRLLELPWVSRASVSRIWPDNLLIRITEQQAVARWGQQSLLSTNGELFTPETDTLPSGLPEIKGPLGQQKQVLHRYQSLAAMLIPLGLHILEFDVSPRRAVVLRLNNGMELLLGRTGQEKRLERFVNAYHQIFGSQGSEAKRVDLRYPNGMAVNWKP